jgi:hypothetical protein
LFNSNIFFILVCFKEVVWEGNLFLLFLAMNAEALLFLAKAQRTQSFNLLA